MVPRVESTLLSIALAGVLTLAAYTEVFLVAAVVLVTQCMIAAAPTPADAIAHSANAPRFGAAALTGLIATVITVHPQLLIGATGTRAGTIGAVDSGIFAGMLPAVAAGVIVSLLAQMFRRGGREALILSTGYAVTVCVFAAVTIGWIAASQSVGGAPAVATCAIALSAGLLVWLLPWDRWIVGCAAVAAGGLAGGVAAELLHHETTMNWAYGAIAGVGVAMFAILGQVLGRVWGEGRRHASSGWGFPGAMAIALAAPVVFVAAQMVGITVTVN